MAAKKSRSKKTNTETSAASEQTNAVTSDAIEAAPATPEPVQPVSESGAEVSANIEETKATEKKRKHAKEKVIRDSFSFPEQDYQKISQLKKLCLAAGIHVKKGEILRAGLNLLCSLEFEQLKNAIEQVDKVKTGRPKA